MHPGSIPGEASTSLSEMQGLLRRSPCLFRRLISSVNKYPYSRVRLACASSYVKKARMTYQPAFPDVGLCFNRSLRRSSNQLRRLYDEALAPCGLRGHEFGILAAISRVESIGIVELADTFVIDRATIRYRLAPLEKAGLVAVVPDRRDKRARRVELTAAGARKLAEATGPWQAAQTRFEALVGPEAAESLRTSADRVAEPAFAAAFRA